MNSWSHILNSVENAIIWISTPNQIAKDNILFFFDEKGISPNRVIFAERTKSIEDHLARHKCADLFVDTFKYNAHSTCIDSLWAGLPVISVMGNNYQSRASASYLSALGLSSLIAKDVYDYENKIIDFATFPDKLQIIKNQLNKIKDTTNLFDSRKITSQLEDIYSNLINTIS